MSEEQTGLTETTELTLSDKPIESTGTTGSAGYASRLSDYADKGVCGLPEQFDTKRSLKVKLNRLAEWVKKSEHIVVITGAGISTSAGIPDFRGPSGVWTLENKSNGKSKGKSSKKRKRDPVHHQGTLVDFVDAQPTVTHRAITKLATLDIVKYCITQNVDGLHRRSGLSRSKHSYLHGCVFTECCEGCGAEYFRDFDVGGMSFQKTGRKCTLCSRDLRDTLLDWEDPLPEKDFERAVDECRRSDLVICLGTSLRIEPVGSLPTYAKKFVIVNLQETPYDKEASLTIRSRVDDVMDRLLQLLGYNEWDDGQLPSIERVWKRQKADEDKL